MGRLHIIIRNILNLFANYLKFINFIVKILSWVGRIFNRNQYLIAIVAVIIPAWLSYWQFREKNINEEIHRVEEERVERIKCNYKNKAYLYDGIHVFKTITLVLDKFITDEEFSWSHFQKLKINLDDFVRKDQVIEAYRKILSLPFIDNSDSENNIIKPYIDIFASIEMANEYYKKNSKEMAEYKFGKFRHTIDMEIELENNDTLYWIDNGYSKIDLYKAVVHERIKDRILKNIELNKILIEKEIELITKHFLLKEMKEEVNEYDLIAAETAIKYENYFKSSGGDSDKYTASGYVASPVRRYIC